MKLSVKTLTNEHFTVDVADSGTVLDAKVAIEVCCSVVHSRHSEVKIASSLRY